MAGKGNYRKGQGPAPASASVPRQRLDGPKKEDSPEGEKQPLIKFSRTLWAEIMALLCEGYTVGDICNQPGMPSERTVYRWMARIPDLRPEFEQNCQIRATAFVEKAVEAARDSRFDWKERLAFNGGNKGWELNGDALGRSALISKTYLQVAALYAPKFAPRMRQEVTGEDGGPVKILSSTVKFVDPKPQ